MKKDCCIFIRFAIMQPFPKYLILTLFTLYGFLSHAQDTDEALNRLSDAYNAIQQEGDEKFLSLLNPLLKSPRNYREKINAIYFLGQYYNSKGVVDSAMYCGKQIIAMAGRKKDTLSNGMLLRAYYILGVSNLTKGLIDKAQYWHLKGVELGESFQIADNTFLYQNIHGLARTYKEKKEYAKALELYKKCTDFKENPEFVYGSYINMATIYAEQNDFNSSNTYLLNAQSMCEEDGNYRCIAICLLNIGENFHSLGELDSAINYYKKSLDIADKYNFLPLKLYITVATGQIYQLKSQYGEALDSYYAALKVAKELNYLDEQTKIYEYLADVAVVKRDYRTALDHERKRSNLIDSIHKMQKEKEISELEVAYRTLQKEKEIEVLKIAQVNRELDLKNQKEAFKNLELEKELEDRKKENQILSLRNASQLRLNEIGNLRKDQLLKESELNREKVIKKIMLIAFLIILIPSIALLFVYYQKLTTQHQLNKKLEEINYQKITSLIKDQELELIKASIEGQDNERKRIAQELHDSIGGNLAAIKLQFGSIANGKKIYQDINKQIDETYKQVRTISHNLLPKKFSQNPFLSVINEYMANIGNASNLKINCNAYPKERINDIDENIKTEIFKILQELITNTIKHAKATQVDIQFNLLDNSINLLFEDNGLGFDSEKTSKGIGLNNIKSRLKRINGDFNVDSRPNRGSIVNIEIPIILYNET